MAGDAGIARYAPTRRHDSGHDGPSPQAAADPLLRMLVAAKLAKKWSPEQIAGWLARRSPDPTMRVSHETIYRSLFVQSRGTFTSVPTSSAPSAR